MSAIESRACTGGFGGMPCGRYRRGSAYSADQCLRCWQAGPHDLPAVTAVQHEADQPRRRVGLPCVHLGGETGEEILCPTCAGHVRVKTRRCSVHGSCVPARPVEGVPCCLTCPSYSPHTYTLVAPLGTRGAPACFRGRVKPYPWDYRVSVCIPHLDTISALRACIATLRWQTVHPYILVIDTGSPPAVCEELERMRYADVEIHYLRGHGYVHSSEPVAVALDVAAALCRTTFLYHTHSDVFAMRMDWIEWLLSVCSAERPVVGYQMSDRVGTNMWIGTASHTATMLHMPTIRAVGASYSLQAWYDTHGYPEVRTTGWPDTEAQMRDCLDRAGIRPYLLDREGVPGAVAERNFCRTTDANVDHVRSYPSRRAYQFRGEGVTEDEMADAIASAYERAARWRQAILGGGG